MAPRGLLGHNPTAPTQHRRAGRAGITGGTPELREAEGLSVTFPKRASPAPRADSAAQWKFPSGASAGASGDPAKPPGTLQELGRCHQSGLLGFLWGSRGSGGSGGFWGGGCAAPLPALPCPAAMGPALPGLPELPMSAAINLERNLCAGQRKNTGKPRSCCGGALGLFVPRARSQLGFLAAATLPAQNQRQPRGSELGQAPLESVSQRCLGLK